MAEPTRVLIADDDDSFREALAFFISDLPGVQLVGEARDGKQLVELAARLHPEVVLTDCNMPMLDGIAATRLLKSTPRPPMVVVCSCDARLEVRAAALAAGADAFVPKRETCARVTALLAPRQAHRTAELPRARDTRIPVPMNWLEL